MHQSQRNPSSTSTRGFGVVKGGTLYPLLSRFETAGWVQIEWRAGDGRPGRKYYTLTEAGVAEHRRQAQAWVQFSAVTTQFIATGTHLQAGRQS
ncbi:MAG: PadR family transcriptional regulator [Micrococcales bacterium]|nr:PadR family transcriptional regulator [Micrococcales bacterium]